MAALIRASARVPTTRASRTRSVIATRMPSSMNTPTSSSPPSPSGWASIDRTCGSSSTPARRSRSSTTSRSRDAPDATASRRNACWIYSTADFLKWRVMLERNGELTDAKRALMRDMERYAASVGCRHRHLVGYFGEHYERTDCGACDYCLDELEPLPDAGAARAEDSVVRRARRTAFRRRPCHQRPPRQCDRADALARARQAEHVRPPARLERGRSPRLHRAAGRARLRATDRRRVSGPRAHAEPVSRC